MFPVSFRTIAAVAACLLAPSLMSDRAAADDFPNLDMSSMWANEIAFQQQFYSWAARGAWEVAINTPNDQPLPFNAMTISRSLTEGSQAFEGYIHHSQHLSNRQLQAVENFSETAIRGNALYHDPYTSQSSVLLPWGPEAYLPHYQGTDPSQNFFMPVYTPHFSHGMYMPWGQ